MSRKGNCWDNAPMESFMATLKTELSHHHDFHTRQEARQAIFEYIEVFYNRQRSHSALGYKTPVQFEQNIESLSIKSGQVHDNYSQDIPAFLVFFLRSCR